MPVAFLLSGERARLRKIVKKTPVLIGAADPLDVIDCSTFGTEEEVLLENINNTFAQILNYISEQERNRISFSVEEMDKFVDRKIYFMANNSPPQVDDKARLLECGDIKNLLETFLKMLDMALQKLEIQAAIHMRTHEDLNRQRREHFLQQRNQSHSRRIGRQFRRPDEDELLERAKKCNGARRQEHISTKSLENLNDSIRKTGIFHSIFLS